MEMPLIVKSAQIAKHGRIDSRDRASRAHRFGDAGCHKIDFVVARKCQTKIRADDTGLKEHARLGRGSRHGQHVELFVEAAGRLGIVVDNRHAVAMSTEQVRDGTADRAAAKDYDLHASASFESCASAARGHGTRPLVFRHSSGMLSSSTTRPPRMVSSTILGTSSGRTRPYQIPCG